MSKQLQGPGKEIVTTTNWMIGDTTQDHESEDYFLYATSETSLTNQV